MVEGHVCYWTPPSYHAGMPPGTCIQLLDSTRALMTVLLSSSAQAVGMSFCPESPVWLEWKGKTEDAWRAKGQLQGQAASALPQISNLGATHFGDVEKRETTAFDEETDGVTEPLRGSEEGAVLSEAESSYLVSSLQHFYTHACMLPAVDPYPGVRGASASVLEHLFPTILS